MILYEAEILHFAEDLKRWKDRYIVVKNDYAVECFENKEVKMHSIMYLWILKLVNNIL